MDRHGSGCGGTAPLPSWLGGGGRAPGAPPPPPPPPPRFLRLCKLKLVHKEAVTTSTLEGLQEFSDILPSSRATHNKHIHGYSALQVSCLAGVVNEQLSMSLYKLVAFVLCTITELSHCLFTLSSGGQLSCRALYRPHIQAAVSHYHAAV